MTLEQWNKVDPDIFQNTWAYTILKTFSTFSIFAVVILLATIPLIVLLTSITKTFQRKMELVNVSIS